MPSEKPVLSTPAQFAIVPTSVLSVGVFAAWVVVDVSYHPLRAYETFSRNAILSSPIWLSLAYGFTRRVTVSLERSRHSVLFVFAACSLCIGCVGVIELLNAKLDRSQERIVQVPVTGRTIRTSKHSTSYFATGASFESPKFPFNKTIHIDSEEVVCINYADFKTLNFGQDQARFVVREGFFHFPWIVKSNLMKSSPQALTTETLDPDYQLGLKYYRGQGDSRDYSKAIASFQVAAERGAAKAQHDLAYMYAEGLGTPRNDELAFQWLLKAARQGDTASEDEIGVFYADGRGVKKSLIEGHHWISLAAAKGYPTAIKDLQYLEGQMTPQQIEESQKKGN